MTHVLSNVPELIKTLCDALNGDPDKLALGTLDSGKWVWQLTRGEAIAQIESVGGQLMSMGIGPVLPPPPRRTPHPACSFWRRG